jgi:hypothetical protein
MSADQWANRIEVKSSSSSRVYIVAQRVSTGLWECSCPGWKSRRKCKHLKAMNLDTVAPITPASKGWGTGDNFTFTDGAYDHYDPWREGFGSESQWYQQAEQWARGRRYRQRDDFFTNPEPRTAYDRRQADLKLLGLSSLPELAKDLVKAMRKRAMETHPDHGGNPEEFRAMYDAYERLRKNY